MMLVTSTEAIKDILLILRRSYECVSFSASSQREADAVIRKKASDAASAAAPAAARANLQVSEIGRLKLYVMPITANER